MLRVCLHLVVGSSRYKCVDGLAETNDDIALMSMNERSYMQLVSQPLADAPTE